MIQNIRELAINKTNDFGKEFINTWIKHPIEEIHLTPGNWFIIIDSKNTAYSIPYLNSGGAKASFFGNKEYAIKTCNLSN